MHNFSLRNIFYGFQFSDKTISLFFNPFFLVRKNLSHQIRTQSINLEGQLLDVGSGTKPYRDYFEHCYSHVGLEIEPDEHRAKNKNADFYYDGKVFPFENSSFDSILCNQVLEHVFDPELFISEIYRVLKTDGKAIITVPFLWGEHEVPHDYARYSSFGLKHLLTRHGFEILYYKKLGNIFIFNLQYFNLFLMSYFKKKYFVLLPFLYILIVFTNLIGLLFMFDISSHREIYVDNFILIKKK